MAFSAARVTRLGLSGITRFPYGSFAGKTETQIDIVTSTTILQHPINVVMMGNQPLKERGRTWEIPADRRTVRGVGIKTQARRIGGDRPSFTVTTTKTGRDD